MIEGKGPETEYQTVELVFYISDDDVRRFLIQQQGNELEQIIKNFQERFNFVPSIYNPEDLQNKGITYQHDSSHMTISVKIKKQ